MNIEEIKARAEAVSAHEYNGVDDYLYAKDVKALLAEVERLTAENKEEVSRRYQAECNYDHTVKDRDTLKKALELACKRNAEYAFCGGTDAMKVKHAEKNFQHFIQQAQEQEGKK